MDALKEFKPKQRTNSKEFDVPGFLEGDFGREVDVEVQAKYGEFPGIKNVGYNDESRVVEGSSTLYVPAVNEVLRENGLNARTATQADVENVLKTRDLHLSGHYVDTGVVLRSRGEPNSYLAKNLMDQVKLKNANQEMPIMIPLTSLDLKKDQDSPYGLAFKLKEDAEIIYAPILNESDGRFSSEDIDKNGLPSKLGQGDRILYITDSGLSRFCVDRYAGLDSGYRSLSYSGSGGRVVVVKTEGVAA